MGIGGWQGTPKERAAEMERTATQSGNVAIKEIYLASSFKLADRVAGLASDLKEHGFNIPVDWWNHDFKQGCEDWSDRKWYNSFPVKGVYARNRNGVYFICDALILVAPETGTTRYNGANIELGMALAKNKPCFSYGKLERSAMYLEVKQCLTFQELLDSLNGSHKTAPQVLPPSDEGRGMDD